MRIVKPGFELVDLPPLEHIERCGRICYKSEGRIEEGSAPKFVGSLVSNKHLSVTEHYRFIFDIEDTDGVYNDFMQYGNHFIEVSRISNNECLLSASPRAIYESYMDVRDKIIHIAGHDGFSNDRIHTYVKVFNHLVDIISVIVNNHPECKVLFPDIEYKVASTFYHEITREKLYAVDCVDHDIIRKHLWETFIITCDRGVSHEIVRHRIASYSQESTRYCNYSKDKFDNEITVIDPSVMFDKYSPKYIIWEECCKSAEKYYFDMLNLGATPQEARSVLPNSLKTEIAVTMTLENWNHFFDMRCSKAAHPQIREIAIPLRNEMHSMYPLYVPCKNIE